MVNNTETKKIKCLHCGKLVLEIETDNCEECGQKFCSECLIYYEDGAEGELGFCPKCK